MGGVPSKKATTKITPRDRAILDLKVQRDRLKQYQKKIVVILNRETEIAKEQLRAGHKDRALLALKKKKYQEGLLEKTNNQLLNLEQLTNTIEFSLVEQQVFEGLRLGNEVLTEIQRETSLEDVEKLMAETAEAIAYQEQISQAISGSITAEDEADIEDELAALQQEAIEQSLPSVPDKASVPSEAEEEEDFEASEEEETMEKSKKILVAS